MTSHLYTSELGSWTTNSDTAERSISVGTESLQVCSCNRRHGDVLVGFTARGQSWRNMARTAEKKLFCLGIYHNWVNALTHFNDKSWYIYITSVSGSIGLPCRNWQSRRDKSHGLVRFPAQPGEQLLLLQRIYFCYYWSKFLELLGFWTLSIVRYSKK
jgi:hypothetical protein